MSLIESCSLNKLWPDLPSADKFFVRDQFDVILENIRSLPLPSKYLGGGNPPQCIDCRMWKRKSPESMESEAQFNEFLLSVRIANPTGRLAVHIQSTESLSSLSTLFAQYAWHFLLLDLLLATPVVHFMLDLIVLDKLAKVVNMIGLCKSDVFYMMGTIFRSSRALVVFEITQFTDDLEYDVLC
ncbi:hypothetical protein EMPG_13666 [Blastomyces silverae]|uniref:Uncharacterized protein n=1 Tax=Blastomyces silverae TaxID=2060906 RepID=A0A0H1BHR9_9EURO|nr:hypothetical protein EMPG_13666 [Blastomyces silverae]